MADLDELLRVRGVALNNYKFGSLKRWQRGLSGVMTGTAHASIALAGDSTHLGANIDALPANWRPLGVAFQLAKQLSAQGIPAQANNFFGNGARGNSQSPTLWDGRRSLTGAWGLKADAWFNLGGYATGADAAGSESFISTGVIDTVDLYLIQNGNGAQSLSVSIDGGASVGTVSQGQGASGVIKKTVSFPATSAGPHTVTANWVSGFVRLLGMDCYLSTAPSIHVLNVAAGGSSALDWANKTSPFNNPSYLLGNVLTPALTVMNAGINDWLFGNGSVPDYQANLMTFGSAVMNGSDLIMATPLATKEAGSVPLATQQQYQAASRAAALAMGVPYVDLAARQISWEVQNALGQTGDTFHPNLLGYGIRVKELAQAILSA